MIDVTITGADDGVDPSDLVSLSREFPFVEWAILVGSLDRFGKPRYPSLAWLDRFREIATAERLRAATHLCGSPSRSFQTGAWGDDEYAIIGAAFQRVQVNGWESRARHALVGRKRDFELILQARDREHLSYCVSDAAVLDGTSILLDGSGGRGIPITEAWTPRQLRNRIHLLAPSIRLGVAGGIGPENVETVLDALGPDLSTWIDMESGVRTDDRFDLGKVRAVLETVARWNARTA